MRIHETAARGFGLAAEAYERGRPDYPDEAVAWLMQELRLGPSATVLDLGAGTGKLTRQLVPTGATIVAVEPLESMRRRLASALPGVAALAGTAEAIPLPDRSVDAVVVAQAFHWFRGEVALREIHRVLGPGGRLGLIWNVRDDSVDWVARLTEILDAHAEGIPRFKHEEWKAPFATTRLFGPLRERRFAHAQVMDEPTLIDRIESVSFIATLPPDEHEDVLRRVKRLVETHPAVRRGSLITLPYRTVVYWCAGLDDRSVS